MRGPEHPGAGVSRPPHQGLISQADLERAIDLALSHAAASGAEQAEAGASASEGLGVTVRLGEVETIEFHLDRGFGVTVYRGGRKGAAGSSELSEAAVRAAVDKALSIATLTEPDPASGLADAHLMATHFPDLDLDHPWELDADAAIAIATRCEDAARAADPRIDNSEGASVSSERSVRSYGNSHGFRASTPSTAHSLSCVVLATADGRKERDHWYDSNRVAGALATPEQIGQIAAQRTVARLGARRIATGRSAVLFPPELARGLLRQLLSAIRGRAQYQESSFLLGAVGTQVLPAWVHLDERPHLARAFGSSAYDSDGVATEDRRLVDAGVLTSYQLSSYSARRLGLAPTGHAGRSHNLEVSSSHADLAALMREMGDGLLVTELMGHGTNPVTGDYSHGAAGFLVRGGELQHPVSEVTIAGNLKDMLLGIVGIGADTDLRGAIRSGSILIDGMTVAGE